MSQGQRIISKSDVLVLHRPQHSRRPLIRVRVSVDKGIFSVQKCSRRCFSRPSSVNGEFDLKVVWVTANCDVLDGNVRNSFEVITPEKCYILQAGNHREKIDWMQALSIGASQCLRFRGSYRPASWLNLEDLQVWLSVREVNYEYKEIDEYKGATYTGKWQMGKPQGMGSMEWPDGYRYDGEFTRGNIDGTGTMLWFSDPHKASYTGSWKNGEKEGHGEMMYRDGNMYRGLWRGNIRHGHGRMEYKEPESLYIGGWVDDVREGYGVFHNTASGEHYIGMWKNDKYHGPGILVGDGGSGIFRDGEKMGDVSVTELQFHDHKWSELFQWCADLLEKMVANSHSNPGVSHRTGRYSLGDDDYIGHRSYSIGETPDEIDDIFWDGNPANRPAKKECVVCTMDGFKSAEHPFGMLVNHLTRCFNESYSDLAQHLDLLPQAVGEFMSVTTRLHQLVWKHCPIVIERNSHNSGRILNTSDASANGSGVAGDHTWLYPILLPSTTDTLMTLYRAHCSVDDDKLAVTLRDLDEKLDNDLCELLEITSEYEHWKSKERVNPFADLFHPVTENFSKLGDCRTPLSKLLCIQETNAEVTRIYKSLHPERDSLMAYSHDEQGHLVSSKLFSYVIVRSQQRVSCLGSEIGFISEFAGSVLHTVEYGYLLTELKRCYQQLIELYVNEDDWL